MSTKPLVSCIIIFLNAEKYIQEAIESVFAQAYEDWELLLVDDGSTDGSTDIALRYAEQYPGKVRYLEHSHHGNRGMSASRNLGIRQAKGEYIAFLDADDIWLPTKMEHQVAILRSQPKAAMVYGPTQLWYGWTGNVEDSQCDLVTDLGIQPDTLVRPPMLLIRCLENKPPVPLPTTIMVRREVAEVVGGFEESFKGINQLHEDLAFASKVFLKASVFVAGECSSKHRQHPDNCGAFWARRGEYHPERVHSAHLFFLNWLRKYLSRKEVKDAEVWKVLQKALWPYRHPILHSLLGNFRNLMRQISWLLLHGWLALMKLKRLAFGGSTGSITAGPNPIRARDWSGVGVATLSWASTNAATVEVHVDAPDGPLLSRSGPFGSTTTGMWVRDAMVFYLQDVSGGLPLILANTLDVIRLRVSSAEDCVSGSSQMIGKWDYQNDEQFPYGEDTTYKKGMVFLDGHGTIEDWGCGFAYAKQFVRKSKYIGVDGSRSKFTDKVVDLREYTSRTDCIFIRHVLEHNHDWRKILTNAVGSFKKRMVLIIFTPFGNTTRQIATSQIVTFSVVPDISFRKEDLTEFFGQFKWTEESLETDTQYKTEHIFYIEK